MGANFNYLAKVDSTIDTTGQYNIIREVINPVCGCPVRTVGMCVPWKRHHVWRRSRHLRHHGLHAER